MAKKSKGTRKICSEGHIFYKSSDCPACPQCEKEKAKKAIDFLSMLSAPARRALENAGIKTEKQLGNFTQTEILGLHGIGPSSLPKLKQALASKGLSFRK